MDALYWTEEVPFYSYLLVFIVNIEFCQMSFSVSIEVIVYFFSNLLI